MRRGIATFCCTVEGKPLTPDDPKLRGLEAYIIAERNGVPIAYGKH